MARIRTIKPEFWTHEDLSALPEATHILAAALLNHADDEGYFNANPGLIKAACSPLREPSVSIHDSLRSLLQIGFINLCTGMDGKRYGVVCKFDQHQRVNRPTPSKIKELWMCDEASMINHSQLSEDSPPERNREQGKEQGTGNREPSSLRSDSSPAQPDDLPPLKLAAPAPADLTRAKAERIAQITDDAIAAFNACPKLTKAKGGNLPNVSATIGRDSRQANVKRVIDTARAICRERYGSDRITREFWDDYFAEVERDDFHAGRRAGGQGHESWVPDFEFLTRKPTMVKIYDRAASEGEAA